MAKPCASEMPTASVEIAGFVLRRGPRATKMNRCAEKRGFPFNLKMRGQEEKALLCLVEATEEMVERQQITHTYIYITTKRSMLFFNLSYGRRPTVKLEKTTTSG